jgi:hypothetical protein
MPADDRTVAVVRGWVEKAENDLKNAAHALKLGNACPTDTVGFHDQRRLTLYATVMRYPGDYEPISLSEAWRAVRIARRVRSEIRKRLPPGALCSVRRE